MPLDRHQVATLSVYAGTEAVGYVLGGVPYGFVPRRGQALDASALDVLALAQAHAVALGIVQLQPLPDTTQGAQAAALALALHRVAHGLELSQGDLAALREWQPVGGGAVTIRTDGSADKCSAGKGAGEAQALSIGYMLNGVPYGIALHGAQGHEGIAERTAIYTALSHAHLLGFATFEVQSDHKFHTRCYDEDLVFRGRRKSPSLERLDALVESLQPRVTFRYAPNLDTDAPHRLALHARAQTKLAQWLPLSRAQAVALKRVHFALSALQQGDTEVLF